MFFLTLQIFRTQLVSASKYSERRAVVVSGKRYRRVTHAG